jgi:hypothetical protein
MGMKKTLVGMIVGLMIGAAIAPATAHHAPNFRSLNRRVSDLESQLELLTRRFNCITEALPIAQYGVPDAGTGYRYRINQTQDALTTALDLAPTADAQFWIPTIDPNCVGTRKAFNRAEASTHKTK